MTKKTSNISIGFLIFCINYLFLNISTAQQYNVAGNAVAMTTPGCYRLTNTTSQSGAVWNIYKINLTQSFDITLTLNFGNRSEIHYVPATCGADGMTFVLQPLSSGVFGPGGGVGYQGITPSLGVVMDTYVDNPTDPSYQHISIHKNGDVLHNTTNQLVSYTAAVGFPSNITDGLDHKFRFTWTPTTSGVGTINVYFGTATTLPTTPTLTYTGNIVFDIFSGDPNVYWGVSGSTGGCWNIQYVCMTTVSNFSSDTATCAGTPVTFTNNSLSGLPISTYHWSFGDGDTSNLQNPVHTYLNSGTYGVNLTINNTGGFSSTMTHNIVVHPKPNVTVNDPTICYGDTAFLIANGATTYAWNNGLTPGPYQTLIPANSATYIVTGVNNYGCSNSDTATITVNPNPVLTISPDDTICSGNYLSIFAGGANTYQWSSGQTTPNISVSPNQTTTYTVTGTNVFGCKKDTSATVYIYESPQISFIINPFPSQGCAPLNISITDQTYPTIQSYFWNFGDGNVSTSQNPSHTYQIPGIYDLSLNVTTVEGCSDSLKMLNAIKVFENPVASFTSDYTTIPLSSANINFNSSSSSGNVSQWQWDFGDPNVITDISDIQNPSYQYTNQGYFTVWLYVSTMYGCRDSVSMVIKVVEDSLVFPNVITPNGDGHNDYLDIPNLKNLDDNTLVIFNRWGKKVYEKQRYIPENDRWDGSGLPDGTYFYVLNYKGVFQEGEYKGTLTILR